MPISYRIDGSRCLILTTVSESLTVDELLAHKAALLADPQFRPGLKELSDVRGVKSLTLGVADVRRLAGFDSEHKAELGAYKLALVARDDFVFGMARMYQQSTDENISNVGVFRSVEQATEWLGVAEDAD